MSTVNTPSFADICQLVEAGWFVWRINPLYADENTGEVELPKGISGDISLRVEVGHMPAVDQEGHIPELWLHIFVWEDGTARLQWKQDLGLMNLSVSQEEMHRKYGTPMEEQVPINKVIDWIEDWISQHTEQLMMEKEVIKNKLLSCMKVGVPFVPKAAQAWLQHETKEYEWKRQIPAGSTEIARLKHQVFYSDVERWVDMDIVLLSTKQWEVTYTISPFMQEYAELKLTSALPSAFGVPQVGIYKHAQFVAQLAEYARKRKRDSSFSAQYLDIKAQADWLEMLMKVTLPKMSTLQHGRVGSYSIIGSQELKHAVGTPPCMEGVEMDNTWAFRIVMPVWMDTEANSRKVLSLHLECHLDGTIELAYGMTDVEPEVPLETVVPSDVWETLPPEGEYKTYLAMMKVLFTYIK